MTSYEKEKQSYLLDCHCVAIIRHAIHRDYTTPKSAGGKRFCHTVRLSRLFSDHSRHFEDPGCCGDPDAKTSHTEGMDLCGIFLYHGRRRLVAYRYGKWHR